MCEFCEDMNSASVSKSSTDGKIKIVGYKNTYFLTVDAVEGVPIFYCPWCGRDLRSAKGAV